MSFGNDIVLDPNIMRFDRVRDEIITNIDYNVMNKTIIDNANLTNAINTLAAPLNSPEFSGKPKVPTPSFTDAGMKEAINVEYFNALGKVFSEFFIGFAAPFSGTSTPNGWLKCNGQAVSRTTYAKLFERIGITHGAGNGSTTFNLPDYRGEFLRVWDDSKGTDSGRTIFSKQTDAMRNFTGVFHGGTHGNSDGVLFRREYTEYGSDSGPDREWTYSFDPSRVVPTANENRPRNVAVPYFIFSGVFN